MPTCTTIALIGPGAMGEAIIGGLLRKAVTAPDCIHASGPEIPRGELLKERYGIHPYTDNSLAVRSADVVILAVKPQKLARVVAGLKGCIPPNALVLSIIAGATIPDHRGGAGSRGRRARHAQHPRPNWRGHHRLDGLVRRLTGAA